VFLFTHDKLASVARPVLELKGSQDSAGGRKFGRGHVASGREGLAFSRLDLEPVFEPGEVEILVGPCADRSRLLSVTLHLAPARS